MRSRPTFQVEASSLPTSGVGMAFAVGFYFSFRIVVSFLAVQILGLEARQGAELNLSLDLVLLVLVCFHSLGEVRQRFGSLLQLWSVRWALIFLVFSCCSLLWSGTVSMAASVAYWFGMAADVLTIFLLIRAAEVRDVTHSLMKGFVWGACCIALIAWIMPASSDLRLGDEEFLNANQIGFECAFAFFMAQYLMRSKDGKWVLAAVVLAVTLLRSLSKTTIVAFVLSESYLLIQDRSISRKTKFLYTGAAAVVILSFWTLLESYYDVYTTTGNQAETLTGRTAIWAYVLNASFDLPWFGHGFDSMWKIIPPFGPDRFEARHAENELLQQFYAYGLVGVCMLTGLYGSLYRQFRKLQDGPLKVLFTSMLLFIVVRGFAEAEPFDLQLPLWAIVLIGFLANDIAQISPSTITLGAQSGWDSEEQSSLPIAKPFAPAG
jgi:exopolysaccharide production protein ExoQ